jgi:hypothetical protein
MRIHECKGTIAGNSDALTRRWQADRTAASQGRGTRALLERIDLNGGLQGVG